VNATGPNAPPLIVATNFRRSGKGTLVYVTKWRFHFYGTLWHRKGDQEWISLAAREWTGPDGKRVFSVLGKFDTHRFSEAAIAAIRRIAGDAP
jgi:hypothetical protein